MILGELLSRPVVQDGRRVGVVVDVRLRLPDDGTAPQVVGVLIGPRSGAAFLGFERRHEAPALVGRLLAWRQRGSFLVDVADVRLGSEDVTLRSGCRRWSVRLPLTPGPDAGP